MDKLRDNYGPDEALEAALKKVKKSDRQKPPDHQAIFHGHVDDTVTIGVKFHLYNSAFITPSCRPSCRNGEVSVFRPLAESDIFIASPLSLALMLEKKEPFIADLLSSVEMLIVERTEVMLMQNWQHVVNVFESLNQMPKEVPKDINLSHVRSYLLHDQSRHYRQTIVLSAFASAEMHALLNGSLCCNHAGRIRFRPRYPKLLQPTSNCRLSHRFERFSCDSVVSMAEDRMNYFKISALSKIKKLESGMLVFVRHYFDYVRLCDVMTKGGIHHGGIGEYTSENQSKKLRRQFRDGELHVLITTERAHFYTRRRYKGIKHVIFYTLPEHSHYYLEFLQMMDGSHGEVTILVCKYDALQLERILGTSTTARYLNGRPDILTETL